MKAGVIHKPEYGYIIDDFVNKNICRLDGKGEEGQEKPEENT